MRLGLFGWLFFGLTSPRERKRRENTDERKMSKQPPPAPIASAVGPCSNIQISKTPRYWKFTQHNRITRPPSGVVWKFLLLSIMSLFFVPLSGRRPDMTEILSQRAVKPKTTNQPTNPLTPTAITAIRQQNRYLYLLRTILFTLKYQACKWLSNFDHEITNNKNT